MNCREYRSGLIEWGRGREPGEAARQVLVIHLKQCAECARFLETQQGLSAAMEDLADEPIPEADRFFAPVMAEFDRAHPARRRPVIWIRWAMGGALAAAILLAAILTSDRGTRHTQVVRRPMPVLSATQPAPQTTGGVRTVVMGAAKHPAAKNAGYRDAAKEPEQPFYPIPYTAPLAPGEWTRVERMEIPVAALVAAGFRLVVADPAATVEADVLVSEDGRARAIRPLSISIAN